jgi:predicted nuclease of predicted toxin-antitoxin system
VRFLIDTNLPKALGHWINTKGHSSEHVLDLNLAQAKDNALWLRAEATDAVIVSKDEDFADLVRRSTEGPRVVWLRTGNGTRRDLLLFLEPLWSVIEARLADGERLIEVRSG